MLQLVQYLFLQPLKVLINAEVALPIAIRMVEQLREGLSGKWIQLVLINAEVAHLVEHDLAKVGVAGSSPVFRSQGPPPKRRIFFGTVKRLGPGGGIGRHAGLKILSAAMRVTVQVRSGAH